MFTWWCDAFTEFCFKVKNSFGDSGLLCNIITFISTTNQLPALQSCYIRPAFVCFANIPARLRPHIRRAGTGSTPSCLAENFQYDPCFSHPLFGPLVTFFRSPRWFIFWKLSTKRDKLPILGRFLVAKNIILWKLSIRMIFSGTFLAHRETKMRPLC